MALMPLMSVTRGGNRDNGLSVSQLSPQGIVTVNHTVRDGAMTRRSSARDAPIPVRCADDISIYEGTILESDHEARADATRQKGRGRLVGRQPCQAQPDIYGTVNGVRGDRDVASAHDPQRRRESLSNHLYAHWTFAGVARSDVLWDITTQTFPRGGGVAVQVRGTRTIRNGATRVEVGDVLRWRVPSADEVAKSA